MSFFKNVYNYIHSLSRGEEVLSDRRKFTYIFSSFAFIHLFSVVIFSILKNPLFVTFNVLAIFLYLGLISLAKKKHYLMVSMIAEIEVLVSVSLISFTYGTIIGYSFYLFAMIPTIFYITSTVKEMKHPTVYCLVFSFITLLCFFTILVSDKPSDPDFGRPSFQCRNDVFLLHRFLAFVCLGNEIQYLPVTKKKPAACGSIQKGSFNQACQPPKHDGETQPLHALFKNRKPSLLRYPLRYRPLQESQ